MSELNCACKETSRSTWLRKHNRLPLRDRFEEIFGVDGQCLLHEWSDAYKKSNGPTNTEAYQRETRRMLRACAKIDKSRRHTYLQACIAELAPASPSDDGNDEVPPQTNAIEQLARITGDTNERIWSLALRLLKLWTAKWPHNEDRAMQEVQRLLSKAASKKYPIRYLNVVIRNEGAAAKSRMARKSRRRRKISAGRLTT